MTAAIVAVLGVMLGIVALGLAVAVVHNLDRAASALEDVAVGIGELRMIERHRYANEARIMGARTFDEDVER